MSPKERALERQLLAKRYDLIRSVIDRSRLKIKILKLYQDDEPVEVKWLKHFENLYHNFLLNCRSILSLEKGLHLTCFLQSRLSDILCLNETWWDETLSDNTYLTASYSIIARDERNANQHGGVAALAKTGIQAIKEKGYECSFCCCISLEKYGLVYSITLQLQLNNVYLMNLYLTAYLRWGNSFADNILTDFFMGNFNVPDEDWANLLAIDAETPASTMNFLTTNSFTQLVTEPTHKDGNVLDLILSNFNDSDIFCIEKHLSFSDHFSVSLRLPWTNLALAINTGCRPFSLIASDIQALGLELSKSLFSFDLLQLSYNFIDDCLNSLETMLNSFLNRRRNKRRLLPKYLSSHSIHLFNSLQTEMKRLKCLDLKNTLFLAYNTLCKELEISLELDTISVNDNFSSSNCDMNDCYKTIE